MRTLNDPLPSTVAAAGYFLRVVAGTNLVALAARITRAGAPAQAVLVGVGHRVAAVGMRWADAPDQLIEPQHPLARRVAGLDPLPGRFTGSGRERMAAIRSDPRFDWLHG